MRRSTNRLLATLAVAVLGLAAVAGAAQGFMVEPPAYSTCFNDSQADQNVLAASLSPAENATVAVGTPLTLSGSSEAPLTFAVASSPALLSNPDIDHGAGVEQPGARTYSFSSTAATANPGTVYWSASFSSSSIPACAGMTPSIYSTPARALIVARAVESAPVTPEAPVAAPPAPSALRAGLSPVGGLDARHPLVAYGVHCSASCTGRSSCRVFALERHRRTPAASVLDLPAAAISIATAGGEQRITHRYSGPALRALKRLTRAGAQLELHCELTVSATAGATSAQSAAWLRA